MPANDRNPRVDGGSTVERVRSVPTERMMSATAERFRAFLVASTTSMYRMSPDGKIHFRCDAPMATGLAATAPRHCTLVDVEPTIVSADAAVPIGLLINELVTNAYKHAYAPDEGGDVRIVGKRVADGRYRLEVVDAGRGVPEDFDISGARDSLGMRVITTLASQLGGTLTVRPARPGAEFAVVFPIRS